jgi:hypothetical protein
VWQVNILAQTAWLSLKNKTHARLFGVHGSFLFTQTAKRRGVFFMFFLETIGIGVGLSMDAFAITLANMIGVCRPAARRQK